MKAHIRIEGDHSVGLWDINITVEENIPSRDVADRANYRAFLADVFGGYYDGPAKVWFDDECWMCGAPVNAARECVNKDCPSNAPEEIDPNEHVYD